MTGQPLRDHERARLWRDQGARVLAPALGLVTEECGGKKSKVLRVSTELITHWVWLYDHTIQAETVSAICINTCRVRAY